MVTYLRPFRENFLPFSLAVQPDELSFQWIDSNPIYAHRVLRNDDKIGHNCAILNATLFSSCCFLSSLRCSPRFWFQTTGDRKGTGCGEECGIRVYDHESGSERTVLPQTATHKSIARSFPSWEYREHNLGLLKLSFQGSTGSRHTEPTCHRRLVNCLLPGPSLTYYSSVFAPVLIIH